ncbi:MAG TPA: cytochrome c peroxidase [Gemmatimonadaceae bacterium]|nr:cytochrome c peroxidase [Gemmatimonadaceae bacterium]
MTRSRAAALIAGSIALTLCSAAVPLLSGDLVPRWSAGERAVIHSMTLASLGPLPADPSNRHADDRRAADLGHALFFDSALSGNGTVSCGTCHLPAQDFQDSRPLAHGITGTTARRTMPVAGTAHSPWMFWDGRSDSQWSQALGPLESPVEHGGTRTQYARVMAERYRDRYEAVFGPLPDLGGLPAQAGPVADSAWRGAWQRIPAARRDAISRVYANIGKAIAAYERRISFAPSRFDHWAAAEFAGRPHTPESAFSRDEEAGLRLFIGKANCINCHNGPLLTDNHFHNTGVTTPRVALKVDSGRATGARDALAGEFACTSAFSDAGPDDCQELRFALTEGEELVRAFKTPSLRNVAGRAPYMHAGQIGSLAEVVAHYDEAPAAPLGHTELRPLRLSEKERRQLEAFLRTLTGPLAAPDGYLDAPAPDGDQPLRSSAPTP